MNFKDGKLRYISMLVIVFLVFGGFVITLMRHQLTNADYYKSLSLRRIYSTEIIAATRGSVYDRNGEALITNRMGYIIKFSRLLMPKAEQNEIILRLIELMNKYKASYHDTLPISNPPFTFTETAENAEQNIQKLLKAQSLPADATAEQVMEKLIKSYGISEELSDEDKRKIAGVRYEMELISFSASTPFTFASDVSIDVVIAVRELSDEFAGVEIGTEAIRIYPDPTIAPHILGRTGKIFKEEYEALAAKGYKMNDIVGKDGIEKAMEEYLRGEDGVIVIERDSMGKVLDKKVTKEAVSGDNIILTIDKNLQIIAQNSLAKTIKQIANGKTSAGRDATSGAVVVIDVNNGEILASASHPTYSIDRYNQDYYDLINDKDKPLFNRAFNGTYAPGSTFKMATGIAALEEGYITSSANIVDKGIFKKYTGYQPRCWIYTDTGRTHGSVNVAKALEVSCNYFFYQVADIMGIEHLNAYCKKLGLGQKTGVEISESSGILAGPEYRKNINSSWYPGDTLQAAIGQSDNLFTPLQLANYLATIVNGGTRYNAHLVKNVNASGSGRAVIENNVKEIETLAMADENFHAIMSGMRSAAKQGTASSLFRSYFVEVGAKTGTASVPSGTANGIFVAFAPYENPEIAVCVIVEHGVHGNTVGAIARDIFDAYFKESQNAGNMPATGTLLP